MAFMQWNTSFETKIKKIDEQHKGLVEILNTFHDAMLQGKTESELALILKKLVTYTQVHFKTEEEFFDKFQYPETAKHKAEHNELASTAVALLKKHEQGETVISADLMIFLKNWLKNHILGSDKKYGPFLNSKGVF